MSDATKAVFLSYAHEDTDAAKRIADALRGFGIEVWFDQSELRGGDAWDQNIRDQIKDCALFVPVVSVHTEARGEGYFRLEWKLADERTHLMAKGVPFLLPVVVDATADGEAMVPDSFRAVQWTRLPGGAPTPDFVAQVKRLLDAPRRSAGSGAASRSGAHAASAPQRVGRRVPAAAWVVAIAVLAVALVIAIFWPRHAEPTPAPNAGAGTRPPISEKSAPLVNDKSIAVLPFTNMSEDKDASAFFADGVHEDILTNLALVKELKVISRTTAVQYRDSKKSLRQIGDELGVAYILEGSVRRSGNKVRVTGQLINAHTDEHVWAKSYDRDITDVFAIQASLSQEIASALQAAITPQAQKFMERRPTENPAAYDSFLKGRESRNRSRTGQRAPAREQEAFFQTAVQQDPNFAAAWGELAVAHALNVFWEFDHTPARLAQADAAIGQAVRLAPDAPDVIRTLGTYAYYAYRDYARATEQYEKLARMQPNDPSVFSSLGLIQRRQGRWTDSLNNLRRAAELEPANISYVRNLVSIFTLARRWDDAIAQQRRLVEMLPGDLVEQRALAQLYFTATGSHKEEDDWWAHLTPDQLNLPQVVVWRRGRAAQRGDLTEFRQLDQRQPYYDGEGGTHASQANFNAMTYFIAGDVASARARLGNFPAETRAQLQLEPANAGLWSLLSGMDLILGQKEEAVAHGRKAADLIPESRDAYDGPRYSAWLADTLLWTGNKDHALAEYARLLRLPGVNLNVHRMKENPFYAPLRGDPRFEALLNDPKNNGPLF